MIADRPDTEAVRQATLRQYQVLDTPAEECYDDITQLAASICGTPMAAVSLIDDDRQWFKSQVGIGANQTARDVAFCAHAILDTEVFEVRDARADARFADNPLVTGNPKIRFYAGAPLVAPNGEVLGTLCVIDQDARQLGPEQIISLRALSRQVMAQLELHRQINEQRETQARLEAANKALEVASLQDDVSGFHNTRFLHQYLAQALSPDRPHDAPLSLVFFDMDRFKRIVDTHGHPLGAKVLREVAWAIHPQLDAEDRIVRYGGDEYVLILPGQGRAQAVAKTRRVRHALTHTDFLRDEGLNLRVTASFGVASFPDDALTAKELLAVADSGLFRSKLLGKDRISLGADASPPKRSIAAVAKRNSMSLRRASGSAPQRLR